MDPEAATCATAFEILLKIMNFPFKIMNVSLKMKDSAYKNEEFCIKTKDFVLKLKDSVLKSRSCMNTEGVCSRGSFGTRCGVGGGVQRVVY